MSELRVCEICNQEQGSCECDESTIKSITGRWPNHQTSDGITTLVRAITSCRQTLGTFKQREFTVDEARAMIVAMDDYLESMIGWVEEEI